MSQDEYERPLDVFDFDLAYYVGVSGYCSSKKANEKTK